MLKMLYYRLFRKGPKKLSHTTRLVDATIEDSFPASDPPSWSGAIVKKTAL